jgi:hypothetical protein
MAFTFKVKTGTTTPASGTLAIGEMGFDTTAKKFYLGNGAGQAATLIGPLTLADIGAAATSHTHGAITNTGYIGTTSDQVLVTGTSGIITTASRNSIDSRSTFPAAQHTIASHSATA